MFRCYSLHQIEITGNDNKNVKIQDYFSTYEMGQSVGLVKTGEPQEKNTRHTRKQNLACLKCGQCGARAHFRHITVVRWLSDYETALLTAPSRGPQFTQQQISLINNLNSSSIVTITCYLDSTCIILHY